MPIYVAKRYDGKAESVVLADSYELAQAYWQGKEIVANNISTITEKDLDEHPTGVLPLISTKKVMINNKWEIIIN